jgi:hypothetical protein
MHYRRAHYPVRQKEGGSGFVTVGSLPATVRSKILVMFPFSDLKMETFTNLDLNTMKFIFKLAYAIWLAKEKFRIGCHDVIKVRISCDGFQRVSLST